MPTFRGFFALLALVLSTASAAAAVPLRQVAAGGDNTCAIFLGGAYCWGANGNGQVGNNSAATALAPAAVVGLGAGVTAIATSGAHSCAVANGAAWCWGDNDYGQLGNNSTVDSAVPVAVAGLASGVTSIATGDLFSCAAVNGGVKCWGHGAVGQLGNGATTFSATTPVDVTGLPAGGGVTEVTAGRHQACALAAGFARCWGQGDSGEVGNGTSTYINTAPVAVTGFGGSGASAATVVDGGGSFTCGIKGGGAFCWGFNGNGQLGIGNFNNASTPQAVATLASGVTSITAGTGLHACAVANGAARCWGYNNNGQLGNPGAPAGTNVPAAVVGLGSGVTQVAAGGLHTCAIAAAGLYCWGDNVNGQLGSGGQVASNVPVLVLPAAIATTLTATPATLAFGGQSIGTSSPTQAVTITNTGGTTVTFTDSAVTDGFDGTTTCSSLAPGASCTLSAFFRPVAAGAVSGFIALDSNVGLVIVELAGTGERSLVTHYYRSILRRAPDAAGKAFWEGEAARTTALGANVNETWFAMAQTFYTSGEYQAFGRDDTAFVTDLYNTFFNRPPDASGLAFWVSQLAAGLPREVALASFMFSSEFAAFTRAIFGNTSVRPEVDTVVDFYRGLLSRLPDDGGFVFWRGQFRTAQCSGGAAVTARAEAISSGFALSGEYAARARNNAQYVGDLYNAFLRRGGDLAGVQFWVNSIATGALTREQVRQQFLASAEFQGRVQAIIAAGCLP